MALSSPQECFANGEARVISLGIRCEIAYQVRLHTEKDDSDYFDWLVTPFPALADIIRTDFKHAFNAADLARFENASGIYNKNNNIIYYHAFPMNDERKISENFLEYYAEVKSKFDYLANKFIRHCESGAPTIFVRREISAPEADSLVNVISERYPRLPFKLLVVGDTDEKLDGFTSERIVPVNIHFLNDGLGDVNAWCAALKMLGLTDDGFKKEYSQIVKLQADHRFDHT